MVLSIITTADGSNSLYHKELKEHYHSIHGAVQESNHVFINTGLKHIALKTHQLNVLEIGFGTGLNALLTYIHSQQLNVNIHYTTLETNPVSVDIIKQLNYVELICDEEQTKKEHLKIIFSTLHTCHWQSETPLPPYFTIHKVKNSLQQILFTKSFDLIYFDAFAPTTQPEMWTEDIFAKLFSATKPNGVLVTYCAKGEVKRTLKKVGYTLETLKGPPGKREIIRGTFIDA